MSDPTATRSGPVDVLFTGHAPVHFACFRPLADRLRRLDGVRVFVSGGLKSTSEDDEGAVRYDLPGLYRPFGVPEAEMLTVEEIRERDFPVVFAANTKFLRPRSAGECVQIFHGISFRNKAVRAENMGADRYFLIGPYMKRRFVEGGFMEDEDPRGLSIGFMKTDRLIDGTLRRDEVLGGIGVDGSRPVLLYAPTGQKDNSLETMGEEVLRRLSATGAYHVIVKPHDHAKDHSIDWTRRLRELALPGVTVVDESADVIPLLFVADLLITDASSVSSEYSLLDRPIVFLDVPRLLRRAAKKEGAMDLATWGRRCGPLVERPDSVVAAVDQSLEEPDLHSEVRRSMAKDLFFNPGRATARAVGWFRERFLAGQG